MNHIQHNVRDAVVGIDVLLGSSVTRPGSATGIVVAAANNRVTAGDYPTFTTIGEVVANTAEE
ncbi:hypothetical protein [Dactylosporangium sp. NPDC051484]|uniref:hypothetical protein n=1 Tax=Dactylosporangium sp. NPDC051484 TaxID=3154942 RepID=UPI00344FE2B1